VLQLDRPKAQLRQQPHRVSPPPARRIGGQRVQQVQHIQVTEWIALAVTGSGLSSWNPNVRP